MNLFRIARKKYIGDINGTGARQHGGRWNHKGTALLYTSSTASLAALEMLVNTSVASLPDDLQLMILSVSGGVSPDSLAVENLPRDWNRWPAPEELQGLGSSWAESKSSLLLEVPSAVMPLESNLLVNPIHPEFGNLKIEAIHDFTFDDRLSRSTNV